MPIARRSLLLLVIAALAATLVVGVVIRWWPGEPARPKISRVILLSIDTLRAAALPFHGNPRVKTPALSALTREAVVFEQAWATSPWTRPSVVSFLTGLSPGVHGATFESLEVETVLPAAVPTLAECLGAAGYKTAAIGFNAFIANSPNVRRGFADYWFYPRAENDAAPPAGAAGGGDSARPAPLVAGAEDAEVNREIDRQNSTDVLTRLARFWITAHKNDDFFLWLHYYDPHTPYTPPQEYHDRIPGNRIPDNRIPAGKGPANRSYAEWVGTLNQGLSRFLLLDRIRLLQPLTPAEAAELRDLRPRVRQHATALRALYEAEVEYVDHAIGRVVQLLRELDLYEGTLLVITSDHGEEFHEHGHVEHGHSLYQELVHVPLLIKLPGPSAATAIRDRVSNQSVFPTLLDLCGVPLPPLRDEAPSLVPLWDPTRSEPHPPYVAASSILYGKPGTALVFGDRKYVFRPESGAEELFDLGADPAETAPLGTEAADSLRQARAYYQDWNRRRITLRKAIWSRGLRTTDEDEKTRKLLRSLGYIK